MATVPSRTGETGRLRLWLALSAGALGWSAHLLVSYALLPLACATGLAWMLHGVTLATLLLAVAGGVVSYRAWKRDRDREGPSPSGRSAGYQQYMGLCGALLNALFGFAILLEGLPVAFLSPCW